MLLVNIYASFAAYKNTIIFYQPIVEFILTLEIFTNLSVCLRSIVKDNDLNKFLRSSANK